MERVIVLLSLNILGGGIAPISLKVTLTGETNPVREPLTLKFFNSLFLASKKFSCSSAEMADKTALSVVV